MNHSPRFRHITRWLYRLTASVLMMMALTSILVSQLLPLAERHPELISRWLSERAGLPVQFDRLRTGWTQRGPLLQLDGLSIGRDEDTIHIGQAEILIAQYAGLLPGRSFSELRLRNLHLTLKRYSDGRWQVRGLHGNAGQESTDPLSALGRLGELQVISAKLGISAPALNIDTIIPNVDLRMRVDGSRARIALNARMKPDAAPLHAAIDIDRHTGNARAHATIAQADFTTWSPLLRLDGLTLASGEGQIDAWAKLQGFRLSTITTTAKLEQLVLQRIADGDQVTFGQVQAHMHWRNNDGQWRFDAPELRIGDPARPQVLDGLMLAGGAQLALHATRIDAGPLLAIAALSPRLPPGVRQWLKAAKPDASAHDIVLSGTAEGGLRGTLRVENLHFASIGQTPGVAGLGGQITLDMQGAALELTPETTVQFNWPSGFGIPHRLQLVGTLAAWWTDADGGIRLMTPALRVDSDGYAANVRGGLWFHTDGRRPRIDMAAVLDATDTPIAKRFWVRSQMSPEAIEWLDMALVSGALKDGRALVSGELDDWPFDSRQGGHVRGIFEAQGELSGAQVRFQPDWPVLKQFNGPVRFFNDGFSLHGRARIGGIALNEVRASLPHYSQSNLNISSQASGDMRHWLILLRQSPLYTSHGDILDNLDASGVATTSFNMLLPLGTGRGPTIEGQVELDGATVAEQRWDLGFSNIHGPLHYDQHGFSSGALSATHNGRPATLRLRAGEGHVRTGHALEAEMQAEVTAASLLARVPQLDWLAPHISGHSHWSIALTMDTGSDGTGILSLDSNLLGTALTLPEPLDKPADVTLPTHIRAHLPWEQGEVQVALGDRIALRTRTSGIQTGVRIALGQNEALPPPDTGLIITGQTPVLEAVAWAGFGAFSPTGASPAPAPELDIEIGQLRLPGATFKDVKITTQTDPEATEATVVRLQAPALAANVYWPGAPDAPLKADFTRLHWPTPIYPAAEKTPPSSPSADTSAPRHLPSLAITVSDLRLGELRLGKGSLRTQSTTDGLKIDQFLIHGPQQRIQARGSWTDTGTQLELDVDSQDIGKLLVGVGLGQQVKGGTGTLRLHGYWPGSPMAFTAAHLTGQMVVALHEGQLLEVEPGAGRVLGLLSVTQLPRRLLLDFRDFFGKGFGFNEIGGEIYVAEGIARTDSLRISGPAAKINIIGTSDLVAMTHDQIIEVSPRTGNLLTAVGAVAGGPLGAAVGAAANAVLKHPLSEVGAKTYHVTGPWQDPKVEVASTKTVAAADESKAENASADETEPPIDHRDEQETGASTLPSVQTLPPPAALPPPAH